VRWRGQREQLVSEIDEAALTATFKDEWPRLVAAVMWIVGDL